MTEPDPNPVDVSSLLPMDETTGGYAACVLAMTGIRTGQTNSDYAPWGVRDVSEGPSTTDTATFHFTAQNHKFRVVVSRDD